jgi:hypothetical protein
MGAEVTDDLRTFSLPWSFDLPFSGLVLWPLLVGMRPSRTLVGLRWDDDRVLARLEGVMLRLRVGMGSWWITFLPRFGWLGAEG